jgi:spermidine synthase
MKIIEPLAQGMSRLWELDRVVVDTHTDYQHLVIGETAQGLSLFCDDDRQSTEFSQLVYHEALLVPALLLAGAVRRVLVVGSSEGVVSQLAVTAGATQVDHVDIDEQAVRLCAKHLPYGYTEEELVAAESGDGPIRVRYTDGYQFVANAEPIYDIVLVDLPDEHEDSDAQHNRLYGEKFLTMCRNALADGGVVAYQAGCPTLWRNRTLIRAWQRFHDAFDTVTYFGSDEHEWAYLFGSAQSIEDPLDRMITRLATLPYRPVSIDAETLRGATVPPSSVRSLH